MGNTDRLRQPMVVIAFAAAVVIASAAAPATEVAEFVWSFVALLARISLSNILRGLVTLLSPFL